MAGCLTHPDTDDILPPYRTEAAFAAKIGRQRAEPAAELFRRMHKALLLLRKAFTTPPASGSPAVIYSLDTVFCCIDINTGEARRLCKGDCQSTGLEILSPNETNLELCDRLPELLTKIDILAPHRPPDFDDNQVINTTDVFQVLPPTFGTAVPPTSVRRDLFPDGVINTTDVFRALPPFRGSGCVP